MPGKENMAEYQPEKYRVSYMFVREPWILKNNALAHTANIIVHELAGRSTRGAPLSFAEINTLASRVESACLGSRESRHGTQIGDCVIFEVLLHGKKAFSLRATIASLQTI